MNIFLQLVIDQNADPLKFVSGLLESGFEFGNRSVGLSWIRQDGKKVTARLKRGELRGEAVTYFTDLGIDAKRGRFGQLEFDEMTGLLHTTPACRNWPPEEYFARGFSKKANEYSVTTSHIEKRIRLSKFENWPAVLEITLVNAPSNSIDPLLSLQPFMETDNRDCVVYGCVDNGAGIGTSLMGGITREILETKVTGTLSKFPGVTPFLGRMIDQWHSRVLVKKEFATKLKKKFGKKVTVDNVGKDWHSVNLERLDPSDIPPAFIVPKNKKTSWEDNLHDGARSEMENHGSRFLAIPKERKRNGS